MMKEEQVRNTEPKEEQLAQVDAGQPADLGKSREYVQVGVAMTCRSFAEYEHMFSLRAEHFSKGPVLDAAGGASSFTADANQAGISAFAADPQYAKSPDEIYGHGAQEIEVSTDKLRGLQEHFDWSYYGSLDAHRANREASLERFVQDFRAHQGEGRYRAAALPELPYEDGSFGLVLCSHFLFLYHEQFDEAFHREALLELLRVCKPGGEVRIYPIHSLKWERYPHLDSLLESLEKVGVISSLEPAGLPFIPGSNLLLSLRKQG